MNVSGSKVELYSSEPGSKVCTLLHPQYCTRTVLLNMYSILYSTPLVRTGGTSAFGLPASNGGGGMRNLGGVKLRDSSGEVHVLALMGIGVLVRCRRRSSPLELFVSSLLCHLAPGAFGGELALHCRDILSCRAQPIELVPKDARVAKQIMEQAMGALQIYRMYHETVRMPAAARSRHTELNL